MVPAISAPGSAWAQLPTTTTITVPTTTTTSTTTTTTTAPTTTTTSATTTTTTSTSTTTTSSTTTTTTLPGGGSGGLSISVPGTAVLSSSTPINASSFSASLGPVTVSDARTGVVTGWTATVSSSDFTTGAGSASETIPNASIAYWSGPATSTTGAATFLPGEATSAAAQSLSSARTAFSAVTASSGTSATWNPTIVVTIPAGVVVGQYQGTITHSAA